MFIKTEVITNSNNNDSLASIARSLGKRISKEAMKQMNFTGILTSYLIEILKIIIN